MKLPASILLLSAAAFAREDHRQDHPPDRLRGAPDERRLQEDVTLRVATDGCSWNGAFHETTCQETAPTALLTFNCCSGSLEGNDLVCARPCSFNHEMLTFHDAVARCNDNDMRLCSSEEIGASKCCRVGCQFDNYLSWTSDSCEPTDEPSAAPSGEASSSPSMPPSSSRVPSLEPTVSTPFSKSALPLAPGDMPGCSHNLASGGVATQSSTCDWGQASRAIDGNPDGAWSGGSVSRTCADENESWWKVELAAPGRVFNVLIANREDATAELSGAVVELLDWDPADPEGPSSPEVVASHELRDMDGILSADVSFGGLNPGGLRARAVRVSKLGHVGLAEVVVKGVPAEDGSVRNLAPAGVASQLNTCWGGDPARAIDGNTDGNYGGGSVSHTCHSWSSWWKVTLPGADKPQAPKIFRVVVHNRSDGYSERLSTAEVEALDEDGAVVASQNLGDMTGIASREVDFGPDGVNARSVRVRYEPNKKVGVALAEVEVFGVRFQEDDDGAPCPEQGLPEEGAAPALEAETVNVALTSGQASQSTMCYGGDPARAIDGNTDTNWGGGSMSHTCHYWSSWWKVDLPSNPRIFRVAVHNRMDCCSERLSTAEIEALDEEDNVLASQNLGDMGGIAMREVDFGAEGVLARSVRVRYEPNKKIAVTLAEVEVFGVESCPPPSSSGSNSKIVAPKGGKVALEAMGPEGAMCTLARVTRSAPGGAIEAIVPLARSYDGRDWGNAAGEVAAAVLPGGWTCGAATGGNGMRYCTTQATLPAPSEGEEYLLTSYARALAPRDRVARFFETATFGTAPSDLDEWDHSLPEGEAMASWVVRQMDPVQTPPSFHRVFWRHRVNAPGYGSIQNGRMGDPCKVPSRWRKVAYGPKEACSTKDVQPIVVGPNNETRYLVSMCGQLRTVVGESESLLDNPPVNFTGAEGLAPYILDLPATGEFLMPHAGIYGEGYVAPVPLGALPSPPGLCASEGLLPRLEVDLGTAIVGRLPDGGWVLYDGTLDLRENTLGDPLVDGGGLDALETSGTTLCSNVARTYLNSNGCRVSDDENACAPNGGPGGAGTMVCGSAGEAANEVAFSHAGSFYHDSVLRLTNPIWVINNRRDTWIHLSITASDQLRQRTAWSLSQLFSVTNGGTSESFLNYYDIFVRGAFGNFRDILREISYSPMTALSLTYLRSKSHAHILRSQGQKASADENYARELMQLFTIGTVELNQDGTLKRDPTTGEEIDTYSDMNIMNFARAWTGFDWQDSRGNIEGFVDNLVDPVRINADWRDKFPVYSLHGGYVGDHAYPLCEDLPTQMFLRKGATYRFIGGSKFPEMMKANTDYLADETMVEFELDALSLLRTLLCDGAGVDCRSQPPENEVVLQASIPCASAECDVDTVRVIKVADNRYWEYVRPPCVENSFFDGGKKLAVQYNGRDGGLCANPRLPIGFEACCEYPSNADPCEESCSDGNPCTADSCTEGGGCLHDPIAYCQNGAIVDYWYGGTTIEDLKDLGRSPDNTIVLTDTLETTRHVDWYGARLRTYIVPPVTGEYTFYVKGDDVGELWLSSGSDPAGFGQEPTAYFSSYTSRFDQHLSQKSDPIHLVAGQAYYLEALQVENRGGDYIAVGWESSDAGISLQVIPASFTQQGFSDGPVAKMHNIYDDERVTYNTAVSRCEAHAAGLDYDAHTCEQFGAIDAPAHKTGYHWTDSACEIFVKVTSGDAFPESWIAIVHDNAKEDGLLQHVHESSENYFPVNWSCPSEYPKPENRCGGAGSRCEVLDDGSGCLCATSVSETTGFDDMPTSSHQALSKLFMGAVDPAISEHVYETETCALTGIVAHKKVGETGESAFDQSTIFEVSDERTGRIFFLKNVVSTVNIVGTHFSFRNTPHFVSMLPDETDLKDAEYQTEAVLDELFYHVNTAPFLAKLFIQRFNTASNPTPTYVESVANAFQSGLFVPEDGTETIGSGKYGDMAALVGAIILHPEARSPTLDVDPASGSIRQPLLKAVAVMRNLALTPQSHSGMLHRMAPGISGIGQGPHEFPTVFSHFLQDFRTHGRGSPAGLYAPEEMVLDMARQTRLLNGFYATFWSYGLNGHGFGAGWAGTFSWQPATYCCTAQDLYDSADEVVEFLATVMTSGRLDPANREIIKEAFVAKYHAQTQGKSDWKLDHSKKFAMQLVASSAEFHSSNNIVTKSAQSRGAPDPTSSGTNSTTTNTTAPGPEPSYKAIVHMNLGGGVDSFNVLVPHTCEGSESMNGWWRTNMTLDAFYRKIRGGVAMDPADLLQIAPNNPSQPCSIFGVHPRLATLASLYEDGDALFMANVGYLSDPEAGPRGQVGQIGGHSSMSSYAEKVDPYNRYGGDTGVLGRMQDALVTVGHATSAIGIGRNALSLTGQGGRSAGQVAVDVEGIAEFPSSRYVNGEVEFLPLVEALINATAPDSGFMAEQWSSSLHNMLSLSSELRDGLEGVSATTSFPVENPLGDQLKMVSMLQQVNKQRGITRDLYYVSWGSFDHHGGLEEPLDTMLGQVDDALSAYVTELKLHGLWEDTVLVQTSEFGRILGPNGNMGTDHGWGGHYFLMGGGVKGGRIIGQYPKNLGAQMTGYGNRVFPTTPWESVWNGCALWMGLEDVEHLTEVCPNREKFDSQVLFDAETMFETPGEGWEADS